MTDVAPTIYLDSNILIAASEGTSKESLDLKALFEQLRQRRGSAITSELTLAEVLGREAEGGWDWQRQFYEGVLILNDFIDLIPVDRDILVETGHFRHRTRASGRRYKLPDSIHAVTAMNAKCAFMLTGDKRVYEGDLTPVTVVRPDENGLSRLRSVLDA